MADLLFRFVLVINLTGLVTFLASVVGLPIATVSVLLLSANALYLGYRWPVTHQLLAARSLWIWFAFLVVWPVSTVLYAPLVDSRGIGLSIYYASLFLSAAVFVFVRGWGTFRSVIGMSILLTAFGLCYSWIRPSAFVAAAELANTTADYGGRAFGFFLQPNVTAESTVILFAVWFASGKVRKLASTTVACLGCLAMVGSTGSRAGSLLAFGLIALLVLDSIQRRMGRGRARWSRGAQLVAGAAAFSVVIAIVGIALVTIQARVANSGIGWLLERDDVTVPAQQQVAGASGSAGLGLRLFSLQQYASLVAERPLTGYGLGATARLLDEERVTIATHNAFMEAAINFGVLYVVLFCVLLYRLIRHPQRRWVQDGLRSSVYLQVVAVLLVSCLASNTILESRTVITVLGALQLLLLYPDRVALGSAVRSARRSGVPVPAGV